LGNNGACESILKERARVEGGGVCTKAGADKAGMSMADEGSRGLLPNKAACNEGGYSMGGGQEGDTGIGAVSGRAGEEAGEHGERGKVKTERQEATALMMDKALKKYGSIQVKEDAKKCLKAMANTFLGGLLARPELTGSIQTNKVSEAIKSWIVQTCGVGDTRSVWHLFLAIVLAICILLA